MKKAKFLRKYHGNGFDFDADMFYLDYMYRGHKYTVYYTVYENAKGTEPLSWQHRSAQARIDRLIEEENKPKKPYEDSAQAGFDLFWRLIGEE